MTEKPKFTPGPWYVPDSQISDLGVRSKAGYVCFIVGIGPNEENNRKRDPNARLIAAAPDMYEALQKAMEFIASEYSDAEAQALAGEYLSREARPTFNAICDALAKAEQKQ